jgi:hypothetical protein
MVIEPSEKEPGKIHVALAGTALGVLLVATRDEALEIAAGLLKVVAEMDKANGG